MFAYLYITVVYLCEFRYDSFWYMIYYKRQIKLRKSQPRKHTEGWRFVSRKALRTSLLLLQYLNGFISVLHAIIHMNVNTFTCVCNNRQRATKDVKCLLSHAQAYMPTHMNIHARVYTYTHMHIYAEYMHIYVRKLIWLTLRSWKLGFLLQTSWSLCNGQM